jgi:hypothetical protein
VKRQKRPCSAPARSLISQKLRVIEKLGDIVSHDPESEEKDPVADDTTPTCAVKKSAERFLCAFYTSETWDSPDFAPVRAKKARAVSPVQKSMMLLITASWRDLPSLGRHNPRSESEIGK